ncbi:MAG: sugar transferase [bacterium]|nr:sugar transferase [bacterium]
MSRNIYQTFILLLGDILAFWAGLTATLLIRYGLSELGSKFALHTLPFSVVFLVWLLVFYVTGLYDIRTTNNRPKLLRALFYAMLFGGIIAMALFYFIPAFQITPRTNLIINIAVTAVLLVIWRIFLESIIKNTSKTCVILLGSSPDIEELEESIKQYPQLGYVVVSRLPSIDESVIHAIQTTKADIVVAPKEIESNSTLVHALYDALHKNIRFMDASFFYEQLLGKIPVSLISKMWFLENIAETEKAFYRLSKRVVDFSLALVLGLPTITLLPLIAILIKIDSRGPVFIKQKRVGRLGKSFTLIKYRTMYALSPDGSAEVDGKAQWAKENDDRITRIGLMLRSTRIDELPQLWNIIKGEVSFIGPRPERPTFVGELERDIPYYNMRHLIRPGLSGWAQINPPYYYGTKDEALIKLQYDLYYIKNRDFGLDLAIALKTLMVILSRQGR